MSRRATIGMAIAAALIAATALVLPFSKLLELAALNPAELALKAPTPPPPPDEPCSQVQRTLADSARETAKRGTNPLTADEVAIYKAVLERWNTKSRKPLNVADKTMPLDRDISDCECLKGIDVKSLVKATRSFHLLQRNVVTSRSARLVNADSQSSMVQTIAPSNSIRNGSSVNAAVDEAFDNGLFELSEIAFDNEHRHALVGYSFVCGSLCGSGGVWLFEKVDGVWKKSERVCSGWVS
jgi:hypothetical protein